MNTPGWKAWRQLNSYTECLRQALKRKARNLDKLKNTLQVQPLIDPILNTVIPRDDHLQSFVIIAQLRGALPAFEDDKPPGQNEKSMRYLIAELTPFLIQHCFKIIINPNSYTLSGYHLLDATGQIVKTYDAESGQVIHYQPTAQSPPPGNLAPELSTPYARFIWQGAVKAGFVRPDYQWREPHNKKRAYFLPHDPNAYLNPQLRKDEAQQ